MTNFHRGSRGNHSYFNSNRSRHIPLTDEQQHFVYLGRQNLFNKEYCFPLCPLLKPDTEQQLISNLFKTVRWEIPELMILKSQVNATRDKLNDKDIKVWHQHTYKTNMTNKITGALRREFHIEMVTNAWLKMSEIYSHYPALLPSSLSVLPQQKLFSSIHLCEAPGAFICATNHILHQRFPDRALFPQWQWTGLSLNPYYEGNDLAAMIDDDRFIVETLDKWYFGVDNSGNILHQDNINGLWQKYAQAQKVLLVTSDGSVDASGDPNGQESLVSELHYTEAITAMGALEEKGCFILKMFNLFECETVCLIYLLFLHFHELYVYKPATSKSANAEIYIICIGFSRISQNLLSALLSRVSDKFPKDRALVPLNLIPLNFQNAIVEAVKKFSGWQMNSIERNLALERLMNDNVRRALEQLAWDVKREYVRKCRVRALNYDERIVNHLELDGSKHNLGNSVCLTRRGMQERGDGTLKERMAKRDERQEFVTGGSVKRKTAGEAEDESVADKEEQIVVVTQESQKLKKMSIGETLMKRAGWREGQGLGIFEQGPTKPIEISIKNDRLGLGHHTKISFAYSELYFEEYDQAPSHSSSQYFSIDTRSILSVNSKLKHVIASLYVKAEDLEMLYRKREELFLSDQGKVQSKMKQIFLSENYNLLNIHEFQHPETALQLASLDSMLKVVSSFNTTTTSPFKFIVDDHGFAEYCVWQQSDCVQGYIIANSVSQKRASSEFITPPPTPTNVIVSGCFEFIHRKVHFISVDISSFSDERCRYLEFPTKMRFVHICRQVFRFLEINGTFICKLSDQLTRFTSGMIYLLYRFFRSVTILKPFTLNPALDNRFLVCQEFLGTSNNGNEKVLEFLNEVEKQLQENADVLEVVPLKCLLESEFYLYLAKTANRLLQREIQAITKLLANEGDQEFLITAELLDNAKKLLFRTERRKVKEEVAKIVSDPLLPKDWSKHWSNRMQTFYYFNCLTNESIWESDWKK